jgi:hypothetical protein
MVLGRVEGHCEPSQREANEEGDGNGGSCGY